MDFNLGKGGDVKVLLVFKNMDMVEEANELYSFLKEKELFKGNAGEVYSHISYSGDNNILLGIGEEDKLNFEVLRKSFHSLGKELMKQKVESFGVSIPKFKDLCYKKTMAAITEGILQSEYAFEKYLTKKKVKPTVKTVFFDVLEDKEDKVLEAIEEAKIVMEGVFLARDLVNERAITMTPELLSNTAKEELEKLGVKVEIFGQKSIEELDMKAFLAVSKGSSNEPQFFVMTYEGDSSSDEKLALVGKGLTFDSGGYSLKPSTGMDTMFTDMAGSAAVIGAMKSIAKAKLQRNVVGIVAACENLVSGAAYKPGDIIGSMSGKTIEVLNTDAEGRLTLADALWYAATVIKADEIVDLATLTGACFVALGNINSGAITNDTNLMSKVKDASELAGEPIWELPNNEEYKELYKGTFGDLKNTGGRGAGTISAGLFLGEFVNDIPWVHLDIAGTSYLESGRGYLPQGATGVHVKTLFNLAKGN